MPAHIYLRMGRYKDVLEVNKDAAEATSVIWRRIRLCKGRTPPCITRIMSISK